ncbi:MAG: hypothetical protein HPY66_1072 [Firmicutes bacterium]|nr:hypothetical protein [Bacillota bacterium]
MAISGRLCNHSGGTAREFHPVPYSPRWGTCNPAYRIFQRIL